MGKIKLPADLVQYELVGDDNTLGVKLFDSVEGVLDLNMLTKEQADRLILRGVKWLRKKPLPAKIQPVTKPKKVRK
jgi:hypothetical protein